MRRICDGSIGRNDRNTEAPAALNMLPKFEDVAMRTYFMVLAKMRRPSIDAFRQHAEILVEQHDVGGVLGHVGSRVHRDPDIGMVQRHRVVDPVAEEGHVLAGATGHLDDPRLLVGADPGEHRRGR